MAKQNGATARPQIEINGVPYDMRLWEELSWKEQLKIQKWANRVASLSQTLQEFFELDDDDDDDDIPDELANEYARVYLRICRLGYPDVPREAWEKVPPAMVSTYGDRFITKIQEDKLGNEQTAVMTNGAVKRSKKASPA